MTFKKISLLAMFALILAAAYFSFNLSAQGPAPGQGKGKQGAPRLYNTANK